MRAIVTIEQYIMLLSLEVFRRKKNKHSGSAEKMTRILQIRFTIGSSRRAALCLTAEAFEVDNRLQMVRLIANKASWPPQVVLDPLVGDSGGSPYRCGGLQWDPINGNLACLSEKKGL